MEIKDYRYEQSTKAWRNMVFNTKGKKCAVCGATDHLHIHHVLPLIKGGTNDLNNLLVVCEMHHDQIHDKIHRRTTNNGRKRKSHYETALPALRRYFNGEIGNAELHTVLGYSATNHSSVNDFKHRYRNEFNVPSDYRNNIDISEAKRTYYASR